MEADVFKLAGGGVRVEAHESRLLGRPQRMDIEWAKDGVNGELFSLQARPETVQASKARAATMQVYRLKGKTGAVLATGQAVGDRFGAGKVRVVQTAAQLGAVRPLSPKDI